MSAMELLSQSVGIDSKKLSKEENLLLEAELFARICEEIGRILKHDYKDYFRLMKFNTEMECAMIENNFIRCLINDIVASEAYTLSGIALYTQTPEDVLSDLISNTHTNPTLSLPRKIIELHRSIRPDLYKGILKKITDEQLAS